MTNRPVKITLTPVNKASTSIAASQTPGAGGNLTINGSKAAGGVATLDQAARVAITSAGADTGRTFTVTGTDRNGLALSEALIGPDTGLTVYTVSDFRTVTQIAVDAATAGAITVGNGDKLSSQWVPLDWKKSQNTDFSVKPSGTINYTVEHSFDDPYAPGVGVQPNSGPSAPVLTPWANATVAAKTDAQNGWYTGQPITAIRVTVNSYTNTAALVFEVVPGGILAVA